MAIDWGVPGVSPYTQSGTWHWWTYLPLKQSHCGNGIRQGPITQIRTKQMFERLCLHWASHSVNPCISRICYDPRGQNQARTHYLGASGAAITAPAYHSSPWGWYMALDVAPPAADGLVIAADPTFHKPKMRAPASRVLKRLWSQFLQLALPQAAQTCTWWSLCA